MSLLQYSSAPVPGRGLKGPEAATMLISLATTWLGNYLELYICHHEFHNGRQVGYKCNN